MSLGLWMSLLEKCLFKSFAHFLIGLFVFLEWTRVSSLYILEIRPLSEVSLSNMFSHTVGSVFIFFKKNSIVIQLQLCAFSPHPSTSPNPNPPISPTSTRPLDFIHVSFIVAPVIPSPHYPLPTPLWGQSEWPT